MIGVAVKTAFHHVLGETVAEPGCVSSRLILGSFTSVVRRRRLKPAGTACNPSREARTIVQWHQAILSLSWLRRVKKGDIHLFCRSRKECVTATRGQKDECPLFD